MKVFTVCGDGGPRIWTLSSLSINIIELVSHRLLAPEAPCQTPPPRSTLAILHNVTGFTTDTEHLNIRIWRVQASAAS